ncbi:MAG: CBS domain-containing protein [Cyanobacteria bacterium P01_F01_bin.53]
MVAQSTAAQSNLAVTPSLASAINRHVLRVSPSTSITDVISQMSAVEGERCWVTNTAIASTKARVSCALITENNQVVGIITERDIVRLTAAQTSAAPSLADIPVSTVMTSPVKTMEASAFQDIFAVLFLFRRYRIRHLPIVDSDNQLIGVVTPASIREVLRPANLLRIRRVADVMSKEVVQAPASASVMFLAQVMAENRVSCVVIVDTTVANSGPTGGEDGEMAVCPPVGIVTERDIVRFQYLGLNLQKLTAREVMSAPLHLLDPQDSLWAAHEAMQERRVRRLVVSWNWGQGLGIVTQTSLLRVFDPIEMCGIIDSLQQTVRQLKTESEAVEKGSETTLAIGSESGGELSAGQPPRTLATTLSREPNALPHPSVLASASTGNSSTGNPSVGNSSLIVPAQPANATAQALLVQASECITKTVKSSQLNAEQQAQLQEAMQIIQQTRTLLLRSQCAGH